MKKWRLGKRIQNWHRPLGSSQLRRRYCQHRYDDPEVAKRGRSLDYLVEGNDCRDGHDPYEDEYLRGDSNDLNEYELGLFLNQLLRPLPPLFRPEWATDATADHNAETAVASLVHTEPPLVAIEERLVGYVASVAHFSNNSAVIRFCINESISDPRNLAVVRWVAAELQCPHLAKNV